MSQLCRLAGEQAAKNKKNVITISEINAVSKTYSRYRLNDIYKEHSHQFTDLQKLIEAFSDGPSRFTTQDLQSQIATNYTNHVGAGSVPHIDGYPYQRPLQLAHFVYKIGFVVGRHEHKAGQVVNFVRYEERPELLVEGRNPDDSLLWEVHPSYRSALNIRNEAAASVRAPKRDIRIRRRV
jgi:hypothetical protein